MNPANVFVRKCAIYTKYYISSSRYRIEKRRKMALHNELGTWGESLAADYLSRQGYTILERDWKSGHRDIDIIAQDGDTIVFVEVKTRRNSLFGEPEEAINYKKLQNLRGAINHYVKYRHLRNNIRLDAITIIGTPDGGEPEINHIKDFPLY